MHRLKTKDLPNLRQQLIKSQNYRCPICQIFFLDYPDKDKCLDHDHKTGVIRAVVCRNCNRAEGKIRNLATICKRTRSYLAWLKSLIVYLEYHSIPRTQFLHPSFKMAEELLQKRRANAKKYRKQKVTRAEENRGKV